MPHRRRPLRLRGYNYARPGYDFVTICAQGRQRLFGAVAGGALRPSPAGLMVARWWGGLGRRFAHVQADAFADGRDHLGALLARMKEST